MVGRHCDRSLLSLVIVVAIGRCCCWSSLRMVVIVVCRHCGRSLLSLVNVVAVGCPSLWLVVDVAGHRYGWSSLR